MPDSVAALVVIFAAAAAAVWVAGIWLTLERERWRSAARGTAPRSRACAHADAHDLRANRLVAYTNTQPGLPDAHHERQFEPDSDGFLYRLVVEYQPRAWLTWIFDATLLPLAIRFALKRTFTALDQEFRRTHPRLTAPASSGSDGTRTHGLPPRFACGNRREIRREQRERDLVDALAVDIGPRAQQTFAFEAYAFGNAD